jgi:hypothetical protein
VWNDSAREARKSRAVAFFWFLLLLFIATTVVGQLLTPKPKFDSPQPNALGDFRFPTAQEGRAIPVIFGTVKMTGGNTVWWGDLQIVPIKKRVKTGLFSHSNIITGYKYYIGVQYALCQGAIDEVISCQAQDKIIPSTRSTTTDAVNFTFTGGRQSLRRDRQRGRDFWPLHSLQRHDTQPADAYLTAKTGVNNTVQPYNFSLSYSAGQLVTFDGRYWQANAAMGPGAFNGPEQVPFGILLWTEVAAPTSVPRQAPIYPRFAMPLCSVCTSARRRISSRWRSCSSAALIHSARAQASRRSIAPVAARMRIRSSRSMT